MGVFMGSPQGKDTSESAFFQGLNRSVFRLAHAYWDYPEPVSDLIADASISDSAARWLASECTSWSGLHTGWVAVPRPNGPWGWKDPRNTYTLPLWLKVFPQAKIISVYRNPLDVCLSLMKRESERGLGSDASLRCRSLDGAFGLWCEYVRNVERVTSQIELSRLLRIKYEDLLLDSAVELKRLHEFLGNAGEKDTARSVSIRPERANAFEQEGVDGEVLKRIMDHPLTRQLGYG